MTAGRTESGALVLQTQGLDLLADNTHGLLVNTGDSWKRLTLFNMPVSLHGLTVMDASGLHLADAPGAFASDGPVMLQRLQSYWEDFLQDSAVRVITARVNDLLISGSMSLTGTDVRQVVQAALNHFGAPLGLTAKTAGKSTALSFSDDNYPLFSGLQLSELYDRLWSAVTAMIPARKVTLVPDFTLQVTGSLSSGVLTLQCGKLFLTMSYAADASVMGYRFTVTGQLNGSAVTAQGTVGGMGLTATASFGGYTLQAQAVWGDMPTLSASMTEDATAQELFRVYAAMTSAGVSLNLTTRTVTSDISINTTGAACTVNAMVRSNGASALATPLLRFDASLARGSVTASCITPQSNAYLYLGYTATTAQVQYSSYAMDTGRTVSLTADAAMTGQQMTVNGSYTVPDVAPTVFSLTLYGEAERMGAELAITRSAVTRTLSAELTFSQ